MVLDPELTQFSSVQSDDSSWTNHSGKVIRGGRIGGMSTPITAKGRVSPSSQQMGINFYIGHLNTL